MQSTSANLIKKHICINKKPLMNQVSTQYLIVLNRNNSQCMNNYVEK